MMGLPLYLQPQQNLLQLNKPSYVASMISAYVLHMTHADMRTRCLAATFRRSLSALDMSTLTEQQPGLAGPRMVKSTGAVGAET